MKPSQSIVSPVSLRNIHQLSPCSVDRRWPVVFRSQSARRQLSARGQQRRVRPHREIVRQPDAISAACCRQTAFEVRTLYRAYAQPHRRNPPPTSVLRNGRMTQRTYRERCLPKQDGFETRPYKSPVCAPPRERERQDCRAKTAMPRQPRTCLSGAADRPVGN
jgi:hypothetical protein